MKLLLVQQILPVWLVLVLASAALLSPFITGGSMGLLGASMVFVEARGDDVPFPVAGLPAVGTIASLFRTEVLVCLVAAPIVPLALSWRVGGKRVCSPSPLLALSQGIVVRDPRRRVRGIVQGALIQAAGLTVMLVFGLGRHPASDEIAADPKLLETYLLSWLWLPAILAVGRAGAGRENWRWLAATGAAAFVTVSTFLVALPLAAGDADAALRAALAVGGGGLFLAAPGVLALSILQRCASKEIVIVGEP